MAETTDPTGVSPDDRQWMEAALLEAGKAAAEGEVPVGAVVVMGGRRVAGGFNRPIATHDPTAHAEIVALRAAAQSLGNYRLVDATLYVTLEPCAMCVGAIIHARVRRLVFGAEDPRTGAVCSVASLVDAPFFNHRVSWTGGVLAARCGDILREFFAARR